MQHNILINLCTLAADVFPNKMHVQTVMIYRNGSTWIDPSSCSVVDHQQQLDLFIDLINKMDIALYQ